MLKCYGLCSALIWTSVIFRRHLHHIRRVRELKSPLIPRESLPTLTSFPSQGVLRSVSMARHPEAAASTSRRERARMTPPAQAETPSKGFKILASSLEDVDQISKKVIHFVCLARRSKKRPKEAHEARLGRQESDN